MTFPTATATPTATQATGDPAGSAVALKTAPVGDSEGMPVTLRLILAAAIVAVIVAAGLFAVLLDRAVKARRSRRKGPEAPAPAPSSTPETLKF
ncbi:hypothetical protein [Planomonospora parontospora]|uniref:hypothetical protein n=1 Tax=Planomonospora parontospora TaxID=58119 RepID=UPI0017809575|nr:hypothetical protein [Planomonospora parontospora]